MHFLHKQRVSITYNRGCLSLAFSLTSVYRQIIPTQVKTDTGFARRYAPTKLYAVELFVALETFRKELSQ